MKTYTKVLIALALAVGVLGIGQSSKAALCAWSSCVTTNGSTVAGGTVFNSDSGVITPTDTAVIIEALSSAGIETATSTSTSIIKHIYTKPSQSTLQAQITALKAIIDKLTAQLNTNGCRNGDLFNMFTGEACLAI